MTLYKTIADLNGGTQVPMTAQEEADFLAQQTVSQAAQSIADTKQKAQQAMDKSDLTMLRIQEAVMAGRTTFASADVVTLATYMAALRAIISTGAGVMPIMPAYPVGT